MNYPLRKGTTAYENMYGEQFSATQDAILMETTEDAFFDSAPDGRNPGTRGSIEAALKLGLVQPTEDANVLHIHGRGRLSIVEAIGQGYLNDDAVRVVLTSPNRSVAGSYTIADTSAPKPYSPMDRFEGTPIGTFMVALDGYRQMPNDLDKRAALAVALEALVGPR